MLVVGILVCKELVQGSILAEGSILAVDKDMGMAVDSILVLDSILACMVVDSKDRDRSSSLLA